MDQAASQPVLRSSLLECFTSNVALRSQCTCHTSVSDAAPCKERYALARFPLYKSGTERGH